MHSESTRLKKRKKKNESQLTEQRRKIHTGIPKRVQREKKGVWVKRQKTKRGKQPRGETAKKQGGRFGRKKKKKNASWRGGEKTSWARGEKFVKSPGKRTKGGKGPMTPHNKNNDERERRGDKQTRLGSVVDGDTHCTKNPTGCGCKHKGASGGGWGRKTEKKK